MSLETSIPNSRLRLVSVIRDSDDVIRIDDVVRTLPLGRSEAAKLLSRWTVQGWLRRVGRGMYVPASLDTLESEHVLEDPWILVPALYAPAYIGGWTAAEHWDLTEQLFRDIVVMTTQSVRETRQVRQGATFALHHIQERKLFGTQPVWRGTSKVQISDVHRTIIDMLDSPRVGGGIQHVADCLATYLKRSDRSDAALIQYADKLGNGAVFKRLGFLGETLPSTSKLVEECRERLTKGNVKLDSALRCSRLASKWRLWVPSNWVKQKAENDRQA